MIECPEAVVLANQFNEMLCQKTITQVTANKSPHKFAWFHEEPADYAKRLVGKAIEKTTPYGGLVELELGQTRLVFGDGVNLLYHSPGAKKNPKHQLMLEFEDGSALTGSVQMYGGLWCFEAGTLENPYYLIAKEKPSPLSTAFNEAYFEALVKSDGAGKLSLKAVLATEQRIPGFGNGVLQDVLFRAGLHPKRKLDTLNDSEKAQLFAAIKQTLKQMADEGGRDTEKDLNGNAGGYITHMSKTGLKKPCPVCGGTIVKESYMGGSIYFCPGCQRL